MKRNLWKVLAVLSALLLVFAVIVVKKQGLLRTAENVISDFEARYLSSLPEVHNKVVIVSITRGDHERLFKSQQPLDALVLQDLISRIVDGSPRVIAVDLDTSDKRFQYLGASFAFPRMIWARDIEKQESGGIAAKDFLGGVHDSPGQQGALAMLYDDPSDKVTRRYRRLINTDQGPLPSFPWLVAREADDRLASAAASPDEVRSIRYTKLDRLEFPASLVVLTSFDWARRIEGKIVLVGGRYDDRDLRYTPLGDMYGVDILANAIETELRGGGRKTPPPAVEWLVAIAGVILVPFIYIKMNPGKATFWVALSAFALGMICLLAADVGAELYYAAILLVVMGSVAFSFILFAIERHDLDVLSERLKQGWAWLSESSVLTRKRRVRGIRKRRPPR